MATVLTIAGTDYDAAARATNGIQLEVLSLSFEGYDELSFTVTGCGPVAPFHPGQAVALKWDGVTKFVGDIETVEPSNGDQSWMFAVQCLGLKNRADRVTITGPDGTGEATYNRPPTDFLYVASDAGLSFGTMVQRILTVQENADRLSALGVGNYVSLSPPTLPTATLTDLAALDIVPTQPVSFSGEGIINQIEQEMLHWHPKYALWIKPDGTIRFTNLFTMSRNALKLPTEYDNGDPVDFASLRRDCSGSYTAFNFIGVNVQPAILSVRDGTIAANWTLTDQGNWKYTDHSQAGDAEDEGTISSLTSTSAVLTSSNTSRTYASGSLSGRQASIYLINAAGTGIALQEYRRITSNTAMSAGGTMTVNWDSAVPLEAAGYTKYRMYMNAGGLTNVWRSYLVRDPATGNTGLSTYIGAHLMPSFPKGIPWANNGRIDMVSTAQAVVQWSSTGSGPFFEWPMTVEIDRAIGGFRMAEPAVKVCCPGGLNFLRTTGSPTNAANGLPYDIKIITPFNRGGLNARKPTSGYEGTAYTEDGISRVKEVHLDNWMWLGDRPDILKLAQEHLDTLKDAVLAGSLGHHGIPSFDPFTLGFAIDIVIPGASSSTIQRWDNLPVRSISINFNQPGDDYYVTMSFSNQRRPFQGDSLYIHPAFAGLSAQEMSPEIIVDNPFGAAGMPIASGWDSRFGSLDFGPGGLNFLGAGMNYAPGVTSPMPFVGDGSAGMGFGMPMDFGGFAGPAGGGGGRRGSRTATPEQTPGLGQTAGVLGGMASSGPMAGPSAEGVAPMGSSLPGIGIAGGAVAAGEPNPFALNPQEPVIPEMVPPPPQPPRESLRKRRGL